MCGISVIVNLQRQSHQSLENHQKQSNGAHHVNGTNGDTRTSISEELKASLKIIAHRGPDSQGQWISEDCRVALGHCRLAINDLTPDGHQPMHDAENHIHAVVNGELYDYDKLRGQLQTRFGYQFQGHSDSELVIALYKHYGSSFLEQLRGEFALCLYDSRNDFFLAARDRYGIKPLFWTIVNDRLLIAAEAKAFLALGWNPEWDVRSLVDDGWHFGCRTLFKGVQKVRPGQYLSITAFGAVEAREYWDIEYPNKFQIESRTEAEMIAGVRERLVDAIRQRLRADVPIGIYLSGGIDSSALAGIVNHLVKEEGERIGNKDASDRIACFSVAFDKTSGFDESDVAARTAAWLDVKHFKLLMNEAELAADLEDATYHAEQHNQNLNFVGKFALSRLPRDHGYKVVMTGEGADEQFAGYPMYVPDFVREPDHAFSLIPESIRKRLAQEEEDKLAKLLTSRGATNDGTRLPPVADYELGGMITASALTAYQLPPEYWATWVEAPDPLQTLANDLPVRVKQKIRHKWHPLHSGMYAWSRSHLANSILSCLGDRTEMAHSVEARTPFLDHMLTEYVNNLPPSIKLRYDQDSGTFTEKWIQREAVKPFVLQELYDRRKHAYTAPVIYPENGPLHQMYKALLTRENVAELGFLNWETVKDLPEQAFGQGNMRSMRNLNLCCQWIILGKRFGVARSNPE